MYDKPHGSLKLFSLSSHPELGQEISDYLKLPLGKIETSKFSCGETYVRIAENVRGDHIYLIQTTSPNVNEDIMEMLIAIDAFKRASAKSINVIIPHYPYSRQDKKSASRESISARLIANLLEKVGVARVITMDLHADQIQGFFNIPVDHLMALPLFTSYFKSLNLKQEDLVVVSPDTGRAKAAKKFADTLGATLAIIHKNRPKHNQSEVMHIIGDVKNKDVILYDDIVDTGGSIVNPYHALKENQAKSFYLATTHPVFSGPAIERLKECNFNEVIVTNTIYLPKEKRWDSLRILSTAELFGETIKRNYQHLSISELYE